MHGRQRRACIEPQPPQRDGWPKRVEQLRQRNDGRVPEIEPAPPLAEVEIVPGNQIPIGMVTGECQHVRPEGPAAAIDDRALQPLDDRGIAFEQQLQRFGEIPAIDVEDRIKRGFDDISWGGEAEVSLDRPDIEEAAIEIAVRRGKAPGATAGLNGKEDLDVLSGADLIKTAVDFLNGEIYINQ